MAAVSLAILGKDNDPLYVREFSSGGNSDDCLDDEGALFGFAATASSESSASPSQPQATPAFDCSLHQQFILHAALDRFEQLSGPPPGFAWRKPGVTSHDAMFVGLLCPVEDLRVYGYMTTTQIRFLLTVQDGSNNITDGSNDSTNQSIQRLFVKLHKLYVEYTLNPFSELHGGPIRSKSFHNKVQQCIDSYNRTASN